MLFRSNQQAAQDSWEIASNFWSRELRQQLGRMPPEALAQRATNFNPETQTPDEWVDSSRYGSTSSVRLSPMEIQEEFQVEPEAGSFLAVDDDLRRQAAMGLEQVAMAAPDVIDHRKVVRFHLSTIRGIGNPDDYIIPEQPKSSVPPAKINISLTMPFQTLPEDVQNQILPMLGLQPSNELKHESTIAAVGKMSKASDHAANLLSPADQADQSQMSGEQDVPKAMQTKVAGA